VIVQWLRDRSSVSIYDVLDAVADVAKFVTGQLRGSTPETFFVSAPARTYTQSELADILERAANEGDAAGIMPVQPAGAAAVGAIDWKSLLKTLLPLILALLT
jgi:hypothetical protein